MKKIEFASSVAVHQLQTEVDEVILAIAPFMIEPGEDAKNGLALFLVRQIENRRLSIFHVGARTAG